MDQMNPRGRPVRLAVALVLAGLALSACGGSDKASSTTTPAPTTIAVTAAPTTTATPLSRPARLAVARCNEALTPIRRETLTQADLDAAEAACRPAAAEVKTDTGSDDEVTFLVLAIVAANEYIHLGLPAALARWDAWVAHTVS